MQASEGPSHRVVLREEVTRDDLDRAMLTHGWRLSNIYPGDGPLPLQTVYLTANRRTQLRFVFDRRVNTLVAVARGNDPAAALSQVRDALPVYDRAAIAVLLAQPEAVVVYARAVCLAALDATPARLAETARLLLAALDNAAPEVQYAAAYAARFLPEATVRARLYALARGGQDPQLRMLATESLSAATEALA